MKVEMSIKNTQKKRAKDQTLLFKLYAFDEHRKQFSRIR